MRWRCGNGLAAVGQQRGWLRACGQVLSPHTILEHQQFAQACLASRSLETKMLSTPSAMAVKFTECHL